MENQGYKNLIVWQKSKELAIEIYKLTENFPIKYAEARYQFLQTLLKEAREGARKNLDNF